MGIEVEPKKIPNNGTLIQRLHDLAKAENFAQYAVCYEVAIQLDANAGPTDAICVELSNEGAPKFYQPFAKTKDEINFQDIFAVK